MKLSLFEVRILKILEKEEGHNVSADSVCLQMTGKPVEQSHFALLAAMARDIRVLCEAGLMERRPDATGAMRHIAITLRGSLALREDARRYGRLRRLSLAALLAVASFMPIWMLLAVAHHR